ncbi:MAG: LytTR family DNA-binding domain-containing protein [Bacteroidota bacterium]
MNVLIVEDELHTSNLLKEIIEQDRDFMVVNQIESVEETVGYLSKYQQNIDLLFFDIQLADGKSFEIFKHIDVITPVVFCTAYDSYTLEAIKNNGIDYVLKPFKEVEIRSALDKYKRLLQSLAQKQKASPVQFPRESTQAYQSHFLSQLRDKSIVIKAEDVALFIVENEVVYLYTLDGKKYPIFKKLEYLEEVCDPQKFFRVNRQMLIHRSSITGFEPYFNRKVVVSVSIKLSKQIVVSRLKVSPFKKWLER